MSAFKSSREITTASIVFVFLLAFGLILDGHVFAEVGNDNCMACHQDQSQLKAAHRDCLSCHVGSEEHARAPTRVKPTEVGTQQCMDCHGSDRHFAQFAFSDHAQAGLECTACHGIHEPAFENRDVGLFRTDPSSAQCVSCHQDVRAQFHMTSHHPVIEGGATCVGCHNPHSSASLSLQSRTEQCTDCHQRVRGPYVHEHPAVVEDCSTCHNPHGSPNRSLLVMDEPMLCLTCHSFANNRHGLTGSNALTDAALFQPVPGSAFRQCTSCHAQVHGSAQDQFLRY